MLHRHCKMCGNTLHTDDTRTEYVSRLGKAECCECFSLASLRSWIAFFSESDSAPCALPFFSSQGSVRKKQRGKDLCSRWQASSRRLNARVPHSRGREHSPVLFTQHDQRPSAMSDMISFGASDGELNDSLFFWWLRTWRSYRALWLAPPSYRHPLHVTPDSERIRSSSASWQRLSMSLGLNDVRWGAISQQAGRVFSHWEPSIPPPTLAPPSSPKFIRAHDIVACPPLVSHPSFSFRCSSNRSALQVLRRVREQWHKLIIIAPLWRNQPWLSELFLLLDAAQWLIPLRWNLLSQANGTIWHPRPQLWALHV